jgi:hypothetical protein
MKVLVWAALFLLLAVVGSAVGAAGMIGLPISSAVEGTLGAVVAALVIWGIALLIAQPRPLPSLISVAPARGPVAPGEKAYST